MSISNLTNNGQKAPEWYKFRFNELTVDGDLVVDGDVNATSIQGIQVTEAAPSNNGEVLSYNSGSNTIVWAAGGGGGGTPTPGIFNVYLDKNNGNDSNSGLSYGQAKLTFQGIVDIIGELYYDEIAINLIGTSTEELGNYYEIDVFNDQPYPYQDLEQKVIDFTQWTPSSKITFLGLTDISLVIETDTGIIAYNTDWLNYQSPNDVPFGNCLQITGLTKDIPTSTYLVKITSDSTGNTAMYPIDATLSSSTDRLLYTLFYAPEAENNNSGAVPFVQGESVSIEYYEYDDDIGLTGVGSAIDTIDGDNVLFKTGVGSDRKIITFRNLYTQWGAFPISKDETLYYDQCVAQQILDAYNSVITSCRVSISTSENRQYPATITINGCYANSIYANSITINIYNSKTDAGQPYNCNINAVKSLFYIEGYGCTVSLFQCAIMYIPMLSTLKISNCTNAIQYNSLSDNNAFIIPFIILNCSVTMFQCHFSNAGPYASVPGSTITANYNAMIELTTSDITFGYLNLTVQDQLPTALVYVIHSIQSSMKFYSDILLFGSALSDNTNLIYQEGGQTDIRVNLTGTFSSPIEMVRLRNGARWLQLGSTIASFVNAGAGSDFRFGTLAGGVFQDSYTTGTWYSDPQYELLNVVQTS